MADNSNSERTRAGRGSSAGLADDPYCRFKDDRERRNALVSRDLRIVVCRSLTMLAVVVLALYAPSGSVVGVLARVLGRF